MDTTIGYMSTESTSYRDSNVNCSILFLDTNALKLVLSSKWFIFLLICLAITSHYISRVIIEQSISELEMYTLFRYSGQNCDLYSLKLSIAA